MADENEDIRLMLSRIEQNQADLSHEIFRLRADLALLTSRQNSAIADTKKKQTKSLPTFSGWPSAY
jgi:hypothetical protein